MIRNLDKKQHGAVSVLIVLLVGFGSVALGLRWGALLLAVLVACFAGAGKEVWDKKRGGAIDWADIKADAIGIAIGAAVLSLCIASIA